jgi:hypothetical protein
VTTAVRQPLLPDSCFKNQFMPLSASSSIIIDLVLLSDAAEVKDKPEILRLARRLEKTASDNGSAAIAGHARAVEVLAARDVACADLAGAVGRLLATSEREIHAGELDDAQIRDT